MIPKVVARNIYKFERKFHRTLSSYIQPKFLNVPETKVTQLSNGLRVATEGSGMPTCTVGLYIPTGSRYENEKNNGVAYFLERMAFKYDVGGSRSLRFDLERKGAHFHACTSREQTIFQVKCLTRDVKKAIDLLSSIMQYHSYERSAMHGERRVILKEMREIERNLQRLVFDHLHAAAFQNTPLGRTILGPIKNIESLSLQDLEDFKTEHCIPSKMVLAGAGGIAYEELMCLAEEYFCKYAFWKQNTKTGSVLEPCQFSGSEFRQCDTSMPVVHTALAVEGCGWTHPESIPLLIASILIGNWDRSHESGGNIYSKLAQKVSSQNLCHSFLSFNTCYKDTGLWGVYLVSDEKTLNDMIASVQEEWNRLCTSVTEEEVLRAKNLLITNSLSLLDGSTTICEDIGRQILNYGRRIPQSEMEARINMVDAKVIREVCSCYLKSKPLSAVAIGPINNMIDYSTMQSRMN